MNIPEEVKSLATRLGEKEFEARMDMEEYMREHRVPFGAKGIFRFEHRINIYVFIRIALQLSGLWKRAKRNYFDIQVERNEVRIKNLPKEFDGYTFLQLSDLHADLHGRFAEVLRKTIQGLEYDCIVLTGDFRTCTFGDHSKAIQATIEIFSDVQKPIYAVLGNHDFLTKVPTLENAGIRFLLNESVLITQNGAQLYLIGIDDPNFYQTHCFERSMRNVPAQFIKILLSHSPQTYALAEDAGIDFLMAGHTHGGQICLPGGYILMHDNTAPRRFLSGSWVYGKLRGYTSRGTGAGGITARLNCPAEVTLHTLRCA